MYLQNYWNAKPFVAVSCRLSFKNEGRLVLLHAVDDTEARLLLQLPEHLMANLSGHFLRERLFGLH